MQIRLEISVGRPRLLVATLAVAVALLLPAVVLATHTFADVPTGHTFHTNIANLAGSGVTGGCGGNTNYCPDEYVTRGQMAAFLNRGLGRVAETDLALSKTGVEHTTAGSVTITPGISPGAKPGATQFVRAEFTGNVVLVNATNCPCEVALFLTYGSDELHQYVVRATMTDANVWSPISVTGVLAVTGSGPVTVEVVAKLNPPEATTTSYQLAGNLIVETIPFGSTGTSAP